MKRVLFFLLPLWALKYDAAAQSLKKPSITEPSLTLIKVPKYHKNSAGSMGLFDWNMSLGYIDRSITHKNNPGNYLPAVLLLVSTLCYTCKKVY